MQRIASSFLAFFLTGLLFGAPPPRLRKAAGPIAWAYAGTNSAQIQARPGDSKSSRGELGQGGLAELLEQKTVKGQVWWRVRALNTATLEPFEGWVESGRLTQIPYDRYPPDSDLLTKMGQPFLDDFVASHAVIARYLVRDGPQNSFLIAYAGTSVLPQARLQAFRESNGAWNAGAQLDLPFVNMNSPITKLEVRDLLGNQHECLIATEKSEPSPGDSLTRMVIRNLTGDSFQTLWDAPTKWSALGSYPARVEVLSPPVMNIGRPGTVTTGSVTFQSQGAISEPVWEGKVEFFVIGREKPVQTIDIHKVCKWTGGAFEPLRPNQ